jgi:hypothetical protein
MTVCKIKQRRQQESKNRNADEAARVRQAKAVVSSIESPRDQRSALSAMQIMHDQGQARSVSSGRDLEAVPCHDNIASIEARNELPTGLPVVTPKVTQRA